MKRIALFVLAVILYGCGCLAQIPTQYVYVDENCSATLPDYTNLVVATDNCQIVSLTQIPVAGTVINQTLTVEMKATDAAGNATSVFFNTVLLDTIPPTIILNPDWTGYTIGEIGDMYKTFYCWVQKEGYEYNQQYAGQEIYVPEWDTTIVTDKYTVFSNTIPIPDSLYAISWCTENVMAGIPSFD